MCRDSGRMCIFGLIKAQFDTQIYIYGASFVNVCPAVSSENRVIAFDPKWQDVYCSENYIFQVFSNAFYRHKSLLKEKTRGSCWKQMENKTDEIFLAFAQRPEQLRNHERENE